MRLIDADKFLAQIEGQYMEHDITRAQYADLEGRILEQPTVEAVPVVRCRECRWCNMGECEHKFGLLVSNDENYCSYGERDVDI